MNAAIAKIALDAVLRFNSDTNARFDHVRRVLIVLMVLLIAGYVARVATQQSSNAAAGVGANAPPAANV
jgi:hypothetical protein